MSMSFHIIYIMFVHKSKEILRASPAEDLPAMVTFLSTQSKPAEG